MIFGRRPYYANNILDLLKKIEQEKIRFDESIDVSDECKNLIINLLQINPENRIEWNEFFIHPWIAANNRDESIKISINLADSFEDTIQKITEQSKINSIVYDNIDLLQESGYDENGDSDSLLSSSEEFENTTKIASINLNENYIKPVKEDTNKEYVVIQKSTPIKIINKAERSRYYEEETDVEEDTPSNSNIKGYFNKSINYLKTSMFNSQYVQAQ